MRTIPDLFTIRPATFSDAPAIFAALKAYPDRLVPRPVSDILLNTDRFLVAEKGGELVGTVAWSILPELEGGNPSFELQSLSVRADCCRMGLGKRLAEAAIARIRPYQPKEIIVLTFSPEFFGRLGFKPADKRRLVYKLYHGCAHCVKYDSPFTCPELAMTLDLAGA